MNKMHGNVGGQSFDKACALREAEVPEVIGRLDNAVGELAIQVDSLVRQLAPVINNRPMDSAGVCDSLAYGSELDARINAISERIALVSQQIAYTRDCLEL